MVILSKLSIIHFLILIFTLFRITSALTINGVTTLYGDQTFTSLLYVASGATLVLTDGSTYKFEGDVVNNGALYVMGSSSDGIKSLQFASTATVTNYGVMDLANLYPTGAASDFVIAPYTLYNTGQIWINTFSQGNTEPVNFTLAPGLLRNEGLISYGFNSKDESPPGFLYLGGSGLTIVNTGSITTEGVLQYYDNNIYYSNYMKGLELYSPISGGGTISGKQAFVGIASSGLGNQLYYMDNSVLYTYPQSSDVNYNYIATNEVYVAWFGSGYR